MKLKMCYWLLAAVAVAVSVGAVTLALDNIMSGKRCRSGRRLCASDLGRMSGKVRDSVCNVVSRECGLER